MFQDTFGVSSGERFVGSSGAGDVSEEYYTIIIGKLYDRLLQRNFKSVSEAFRAFDVDGDRQITRQEFDEALRKMNIGESADERLLIFKRINQSGSGVITDAEFERVIQKAPG